MIDLQAAEWLPSRSYKIERLEGVIHSRHEVLLLETQVGAPSALLRYRLPIARHVPPVGMCSLCCVCVCVCVQPHAARVTNIVLGSGLRVVGQKNACMCVCVVSLSRALSLFLSLFLCVCACVAPCKR